MNIKKMFDECKEKFGSVFWDDVELALTQDPYPDTDCLGDSCFYADAMDADGNLWWVMWYAIPDVDTCLDYCDQVEDWDKPDFAEMVDEGYYLD